MPHRVLILTTSTSTAGESGTETGFDWMSLAVPYWRLREAGTQIAFASVRGGKPPGDPTSATLGETETGEQSGAVNMFLGDEAAVQALSHSLSVTDATDEAWDAVVAADGHGALWDIAQSDAVASLVTQVWAQGGVVAAIGAGTGALLGAEGEDGGPLVAGLRLTCLPSYAVQAPKPSLNLEEGLRNRGAQLYTSASGEPPVIIEEGRLITGQDARTSAEVTLQLLDALDVYRA